MTPAGRHQESTTAHHHRKTYEAVHEQWCFVADDLVQRVVEAMKAADLHVLVEGRAKDPRSFEGKVRRIMRERANFDYDASIEDLAAIRIIANSRHDKRAAIVAFSTMIEALGGEIRTTVVSDRVDALSPWEFAYRSHHINFRLAETPPEGEVAWDVAKNRWLEAQVRTVAEHAWAEIDHQYRYKSAVPLTRVTMRHLFMLAAQLEAIDLQIDELRRNVREPLSDEVRLMLDGQSDVPTSQATVALFVRTADVVEDFLSAAEDAGWHPVEPVQVADHASPLGPEPKLSTPDDVDSANQEEESSDQLCALSCALGSTTISALSARISEIPKDILGRLANAGRGHNLSLNMQPADLIALAILAATAGPLPTFYRIWHPSILEARRTPQVVDGGLSEATSVSPDGGKAGG